MALNKEDIKYRDNAKIRIRNRVVVGIIVGLFSNWPYLFVLALFTY